jgi:hypothetical protein
VAVVVVALSVFVMQVQLIIASGWNNSAGRTCSCSSFLEEVMVWAAVLIDKNNGGFGDLVTHENGESEDFVGGWGWVSLISGFV